MLVPKCVEFIFTVLLAVPSQSLLAIFLLIWYRISFCGILRRPMVSMSWNPTPDYPKPDAASNTRLKKGHIGGVKEERPLNWRLCIARTQRLET
jgi:hypothetical protein